MISQSSQTPSVILYPPSNSCPHVIALLCVQKSEAFEFSPKTCSFFCIITTLCALNLEYFYSCLRASEPASALAGIQKIKKVQAAVSVGELRSVSACSAGRRKERRDKAAFRSAHQSGIHTGISRFHRRSQKVVSQKLNVWSWFILCWGGRSSHHSRVDCSQPSFNWKGEMSPGLSSAILTFTCLY